MEKANKNQNVRLLDELSCLIVEKSYRYRIENKKWGYNYFNLSTESGKNDA